jgi:hypothetical protein
MTVVASVNGTSSHPVVPRPAVFVAAHDLVTAVYCSPSAHVYLIGTATKVSEAKAMDAPIDWGGASARSAVW